MTQNLRQFSTHVTLNISIYSLLMEKESSYIAPQDTTASLFQDLGSELDFGKENILAARPNEQKHHPLAIAKMITGGVFILLVLFSVGA